MSDGHMTQVLAGTTSNVTILSRKDFYDNRQLIKILHWFSK